MMKCVTTLRFCNYIWSTCNTELLLMLINNRCGVAGCCEVVTLTTLLCQDRILSDSYLLLSRGSFPVQKHSGKIKI